MRSNLPPGVTEAMLPGNRPEDSAWELLHSRIDEDCAQHSMSDMDALMAWEFGIAAYNTARKLRVNFLHDIVGSIDMRYEEE